MTYKPIIVSETFQKPVDIVWNAITNVSEMRIWFFENIKAFQPVVGFESFPQNILEFTRASCETGWHYFISKNLVEYLKKS